MNMQVMAIRARGPLAALALAAGSLAGCGGDDTPVTRAFFIQPEIFSSFVALIGATSAIVAQHAVQVGEVDLTQLSPSCGAGDPGNISALRTCTYDAGTTTCQTLENFGACTFADGKIVVDTTMPGDGTLNIQMTNTAFLNGNLEADPPATEVQYDGAITIDVDADAQQVIFQEAQGIVATQEDGTITDIDASSTFTIGVGADRLTFNGMVEYDVTQRNIDPTRRANNLGIVSATLTDFVLPLSAATCTGPLSGTIDITIPSFNEAARAIVSGCNQMELQNIDGGVVVARTTLPQTDVAGIFDTTLALIAVMAAAPGSALPVADAPFDAAAEITAFAEPDTWCRLFTSSADVPAVAGAAERAPTPGALAAECLLFGSAATTAFDLPSSERSLTTALFALAGTSGTEADIELLSVQAGVPVWNPTDGALTAVLAFKAAVGTNAAVGEVDTLADLRMGAGAALLFPGTTTGALANPFSEGLTEPVPGIVIPDMRCIGSDNPSANASTAPSEQCVPDFVTVGVDFSPVGMWLLDAGSGDALGLYVKIATGE